MSEKSSHERKELWEWWPWAPCRTQISSWRATQISTEDAQGPIDRSMHRFATDSAMQLDCNS